LKRTRVVTLKSQVFWLDGLPMRWPVWHMVVQSSHDGHMTSDGLHIPEAVGVHSDHGSGCDFRCDGKRPMGPGQV